MATWTNETEFWQQVVRYGLPRCRFLRRACRPEQLDVELGDWAPWQQLRASLQPGDKIWPFRFPRSPRYWGKRCGYVVLRRGKFVGGVVKASE